MRYRFRALILLSYATACLAGLGFTRSLYAIEPENVLVLYNADDGVAGPGFQIASDYQSRRPGVHLAGLTGINDVLTGPQNEEISASDYLDADSGIRRQVLDRIAAIPDRIDVIVTTKGLPLRINNSSGHPYSSLESELTRIDSISSAAEMGNVASINASNPYYNFLGFPFSQELFNMRLTSRLDGRTVQDVKDAIERAQDVYIVPFGHYVVADDDPNGMTDELIEVPGQSGLGPGPGLVDPVQLDGALEHHGQAYFYDPSEYAINEAPGPVIGYVSHGTHDGGGGLGPNYIVNQLELDLAKGAVFSSFESFNAKSFDPDYSQGQGLVADWLAIGGTAALGQVEEPFNSFMNITNEDLFYDYLLPAAGAAPGESGLTFAEAAWQATYHLSYVNTVVGDPLMRWKAWIPGDVNLNGLVNNADLGPLFGFWGRINLAFAQGDVNGDKIINAVDAGIMFGNWTTPPPSALAASAVPEPTGMLIAALGLGGLLVARRGLRYRGLGPRRCLGCSLSYRSFAD